MSTKKKKTTKIQPNKAKLQAAKKKGAWFVAVRWSYLPASPQGWALYAPYTLLLVLIITVAAYQNSVAEGVVIALPGLFAVTAAMHWIASHKS